MLSMSDAVTGQRLQFKLLSEMVTVHVSPLLERLFSRRRERSKREEGHKEV
jgi:hypothetical protein